MVSERCDVFVVFLNRLKCLVKCGCHADYAGCVGRAAAVRSFLLAAGEKFLDANAVSHIQHAHTLGAVKLVCGHGKQVDAQILDVVLDRARCLNCVRMEQNAVIVRDLAKFFDRLDSAYFVVCKHNAYKHRVGTDCFFKVVGRNESLVVNGKIRDFPTEFFKLFASRIDCGMLNHRGDDMFAFLDILKSNAFDRPVVRFGAA